MINEIERSVLRIDAHPNAKDKINRIASELYDSIGTLEFSQSSNQTFKSDRPVGSKITDEDIIGDPVYRNHTIDGDFGISFLRVEGVPCGLKGAALSKLDDLISVLTKIKFIARSASDQYLENSIFEWLKTKKKEETKADFWSFLEESLKRDVKETRVYVPIDGVQFGSDYKVGEVTILSFEKAYFDKWESNGLRQSPDQSEQIKGLFDQMRQKMQGLAAVRVDMQVEQTYAHNAAFEIAGRVCDVLRIFAPQRDTLQSRALYAPLGISLHPMSHTVLESGEDSFSYHNASLDSGGYYWTIDDSYFQNMLDNHFASALNIAVSNPQTDFEGHVWKSIQAFSKSLSPVDINDRIAFRVSAIESMLLMSNSEPIGTMVGERMAFLLGNNADHRREIVKCFKSVYKMRSDYVHHRKTRNDQNEMEYFAYLAWHAMQKLLQNIDQFSKTSDFFDTLEQRRYGG